MFTLCLLLYMYPFIAKVSYMSRSKAKLILKHCSKFMQHLTEKPLWIQYLLQSVLLLMPRAKARDWLDKDSEKIRI